MSGDPTGTNGILDNFRREVLRWNEQINLVSRQDTARRLKELIGQCRDGWDNLAASGVSGLTGASRLWYFDLGSGAGLPGFIWHVQMAAAGLSVRTLLVEPREKRAWFLERVAPLAGQDPPQVLAARWGETGESGLAPTSGRFPPSHVVVSLKALHLPDTAVLEGLTPFLGVMEDTPGSAGAEISLLIVRFFPPDQEWSEDLAGELKIPSIGKMSGLFRSMGGRVLPPANPTGASLVLSEYRILIP